ncbi:ANGPT2 [Mytilus edulis]|uniref:ANGPT2 n=1 Tax=Mytilus edulis TaxID=6550 RepID=A0A8S3RDL3_MYTED|nr:ANGPT2 [Mytilus edulis]
MDKKCTIWLPVKVDTFFKKVCMQHDYFVSNDIVVYFNTISLVFSFVMEQHCINMLHCLLVLSLLFALNSSLESKDIRDVRTNRESEEKTRVDDILHELQGICLQENELRDVTKLKKDTQSILKSMAVYKDVVKMNKQLKDDIKWILEESRGEKEVSRIVRLLKHDVKGICGRKETGKDCTELKKSTATSGVYQIFPDKTEGVKAYCDMDTDNGGWTIIQKRYDGSVNFQRSWTEYENGFGNVKGEYWLGNKHIHRLTSRARDILAATRSWEKEQDHYNIYTNNCVPGEMCGHYTQMVWADTETVGCAMWKCPYIHNLGWRDAYIVVCDYGPGGNISGRKPYIIGQTCAECSKSNLRVTMDYVFDNLINTWSLTFVRCWTK